jgi:hypothetical protein
MGLVNGRREVIYIALSGMEACWFAAWARVLIKDPVSAEPLVSWWSVFLLFLVALVVVRVVGSLELRYDRWLIAGLTLLTAGLLVQVSLGASLHFLRHHSDPAAERAIFICLLGFAVWYRALRVAGNAGDARDAIRRFQFGLLILVAATLVTRRAPLQMADLVFAYFGFGLLAVALTRIEEVAQTEAAGAAPLDLKWVITLAGTLLAVGAVVLLAGRVITIDAIRWALRPVVTLLQVALVVLVYLMTSLLMQILPLLTQWFDRFPATELDETMQQWRETAREPLKVESTEGLQLSAQLVEALQWIVIVAVVAAGLWLVARSFRRWRLEQRTTPGGVREPVTSTGTIAEDLARYLLDQWGRLRDGNLSRRFRRMGAESVRAIYTSLLHLMADAGLPRLPEQTPYEFISTAEKVLPDRRAELEAITEAYVRARYGEVDITAEELARLRDTWQRVKADVEALPKIGIREHPV